MTGWHEANQRYLSAMVDRIADLLRRHADEADAGAGEGEDRVEAAAAALPAPAALGRVCAAFGLSDFERDLLVLCAGMELQGGFGERCARARGDARLGFPTFGLALAALPGAHWSAITPGGPLRRWRLIDVLPGDQLTTSRLRIDERVLHHLTGVDHLDERLYGLVWPVPPGEDLAPSHAAIADQVAALRRRSTASVQLSGPEPATLRAIAARACSEVGVQLHAIGAGDVPAAAGERDALARLWERESVLSASALLVDFEDTDGPEAAAAMRPAASFVEGLHGVVLVASREPVTMARRPSVRVDVGRPDARERRTLWMDALGASASDLDGCVDAVVSQFDLDGHGIRAASSHVTGCTPSDGENLGSTLWDACRAQARTRLNELALRIAPVATWDDLVLPEPQRQTLREIAAHVRYRTQVYEAWGFARKTNRGLGICALFAGPSGTGKTMAAEVLANELRLDLFRIDLSQVVSKYIGETDKNLRRVFDAAEAGGSVLLFDEADALFGKRSEVKDSHDRYANIEVSYLLQRMEAYRGLAVLTTNMKSALDPAFLRRIRFVVQFPFPDADQRAEIWRRTFPADTPVQDLHVDKLARLNVAGGNIRNIAMNAAFLAADEGTAVGMTHLLRSARSEYGKLERPLTDAEVRGWI